MSMTTVSERSARRWISLGLLGGILGAILMAVFAMVAAATYQDTGFFTPMYHIASSVGWTSASDAMKSSMDAAKGGDLYLFTAGPALAGFGIHLAVGLFWGAVFSLVALRAGGRTLLVPAGAVYGLAVMAFMAYAALPVIAEIFDSGPPIRDMAQMVGWGTFSAEHAIYGSVLGATLWLGSRAARERVPALEQEPRARRTAA